MLDLREVDCGKYSQLYVYLPTKTFANSQIILHPDEFKAIKVEGVW